MHADSPGFCAKDERSLKAQKIQADSVGEQFYDTV